MNKNVPENVIAVGVPCKILRNLKMNKRILAMIPARIGSQRLKKKIYFLINKKKPLIEYVIESAKKSGIF